MKGRERFTVAYQHFFGNEQQVLFINDGESHYSQLF
jgi:hypothetical protein